MAFKVIGHASGAPITGTATIRFDAISFAVRKGALITQTPSSGASCKLYAGTVGCTGSALAIFGVATNAQTSSATGVVDVQLTPCGTILEADVELIDSAITLTADSGTSTTFVDSALMGCGDDGLAGSEVEIISIAQSSATCKAGTKLTVIGSTNATGTLTFASSDALGAASCYFAAGDTIKFTKLGRGLIGEAGLVTDSTYGDRIMLRSTGVEDSGTGFRCINVTPDGKKLHLVVKQGCDSQNALTLG